MKRKPIVGISMKTYKNNNSDMIEYAESLNEKIQVNNDVDVFIFPSMGTLYTVSKVLKDSEIKYGAQNMSPFRNGAYTGELSVETLLELEADYVELGHYERRSIFKETDEMISDKVKLALDNDISPVICIGEPEKKDGNFVKEYLTNQIKKALSKVHYTQINNVVFAYEPVWAIGKQKSADFHYIHKVHEVIRTILKELFGEENTELTRLIYGGSVSLENAEDILNSINVDGVFVGRFGHDVNQFLEIIELAK